MKTTIVPVVEGHGEREAVTILMRRIAPPPWEWQHRARFGFRWDHCSKTTNGTKQST